MPVHVDGRELGLRHLVLGHHQRVARAIVEDARRRFRGRHAAAGPYFGSARRAILAGRDARAAASLRGEHGAYRAADQDDENGSKESHGIPILTRTQPPSRTLVRNLRAAPVSFFCTATSPWLLHP